VQGVPYAAQPFGANRRHPQPVPPWSGVRDTLTYGPKPSEFDAIPERYPVFRIDPV